MSLDQPALSFGVTLPLQSSGWTIKLLLKIPLLGMHKTASVQCRGACKLIGKGILGEGILELLHMS
jgi:hypothetical protein